MPKRILEGMVVSDKGDKTVVVKVERTIMHPLLKKPVRVSKRYHAHDEANEFKTGEAIRIIECRQSQSLSLGKSSLAKLRPNFTGSLNHDSDAN